MKKALSVLAIMALVSGQAFAQTAPAPGADAGATAGPAPAPMQTPNLVSTPSTGLSTTAMISIGVALAAVAAAASDNSTTTTHATTTHH